MELIAMTWFKAFCCLALLQVSCGQSAAKANPALNYPTPVKTSSKNVIKDAVADAATYFDPLTQKNSSPGTGQRRNTAASFFQLSEYGSAIPPVNPVKPPNGTLPVRTRQVPVTIPPQATDTVEVPTTPPTLLPVSTVPPTVTAVQTTTAPIVSQTTTAPRVTLKQYKSSVKNKTVNIEDEVMKVAPSTHQSHITYIIVMGEKGSTEKYTKYTTTDANTYVVKPAKTYQPTKAPYYESTPYYERPQSKYGVPKAEPYREKEKYVPSYEPEYDPYRPKYDAYEESTWEARKTDYEPQTEAPKKYYPGYLQDKKYRKPQQYPEYKPSYHQPEYEPEYRTNYYPNDNQRYEKRAGHYAPPAYDDMDKKGFGRALQKSYYDEYPSHNYRNARVLSSFPPIASTLDNFQYDVVWQKKYRKRRDTLPTSEVVKTYQKPNKKPEPQLVNRKDFELALHKSYNDLPFYSAKRTGKSYPFTEKFPPITSSLENLLYNVAWTPQYRKKRDTQTANSKPINTSGVKFQSLPKLMAESVKAKQHERRENPSYGNRPIHYDAEKKESYEGPYVMTQLFGPPYEIGYIRSPVPDKHIYQDYLQFMKSSMTKTEKRDEYPAQKSDYKTDAYASATHKVSKGTYGESYADSRYVSDYEAPTYSPPTNYKSPSYSGSDYPVKKEAYGKDSYMEAAKDPYPKDGDKDPYGPKKTYGAPVYEPKKDTYPTPLYKEKENYKAKDEYTAVGSYKLTTPAYEKENYKNSADYGTAKTNYEAKYPEPKYDSKPAYQEPYAETKYDKKDDYKQDYAEPAYQGKDQYKSSKSYEEPKAYEKPYEEPKAYEKPYEAPKAYEKPYEAPKAYEKPYEAPKAYEKPYEAPKAYEKPYEAPKSYDKPYEAPKAYEKPYEAPKAYEKPYEAPKAYEKPYEANTYEKPYEAPKAYEKPYEAPKAYEKPYDAPKAYEKPYEAPKAYEKPYEAPKAYEKPYEAPKAYEKPYEAPKAYEDSKGYDKEYEAPKSYDKPYEDAKGYEKPYEAPKSYEKPYEAPKSYEKPYAAQAYDAKSGYDKEDNYKKPYEADYKKEEVYQKPYEAPKYEQPKYEKPAPTYEKGYEAPKSYEKPYDAGKSYEKPAYSEPYSEKQSYDKPYETPKSYEKPYEAPKTYNKESVYDTEKLYEASDAYDTPKSYGGSKGYDAPKAYEGGKQESYDKPYQSSKAYEQSYDQPKGYDSGYDAPKTTYDEKPYTADKYDAYDAPKYEEPKKEYDDYKNDGYSNTQYEEKKKYPVIIGRYQVTSSDAFLPTKVGTKEEYKGSTYKKEEEYVVYYLPYGQPLPVPIQKRSVQVEEDMEVGESRLRGGSVFHGPLAVRSADKSDGLHEVVESKKVDNVTFEKIMVDEEELENLMHGQLNGEAVEVRSAEALLKENQELATTSISEVTEVEVPAITTVSDLVTLATEQAEVTTLEKLEVTEPVSDESTVPSVTEELIPEEVLPRQQTTPVVDEPEFAVAAETESTKEETIEVTTNAVEQEQVFVSEPLTTEPARSLYGIAYTTSIAKQVEPVESVRVQTPVVVEKVRSGQRILTSPPLTSKLEKHWNGYTTWWTKPGLKDSESTIRLIRKRMPKLVA